MQAIFSFDELSARFAEAERRREISDDAFRASLSAWYLSPSLFGDAPPDPYSREFRDYQLGIYRRLTGRPYEERYEETEFDFEHELQHPYPYGTESAQTVGNHLMGYGWVIRSMDLPPRSRILEIGSGYGALTVHLASMGYRVTCLDISSSLLEFVKARTAHLPEPIDTICGDMATAEIERTFDCVIFNASLHHSLKHRAVIQRLDDILSSEGVVAFAAEPVVPSGSEIVPYPWGIRLDGMSVWSVAKWGWLELGFQEPYFVRLIEDLGLRLRRHSPGLSDSMDLWIADGGQHGDRDPVSPTEAIVYDSDLKSEVLRLRQLVKDYESGRFMRLMAWLSQQTTRLSNLIAKRRDS